MGNSAATQAMATPSPYEFVSNMIPGPQVEPFWTQVRERCQQLGIHDPGPYGPCTEEDWQEVSKICQIHKNSYPPGKWENIQYMKDCYHAWDKCLCKYKKKHINKTTKLTPNIGPSAMAEATAPPSPPPPPPQCPPPPYVMVKNEDGTPGSYLQLYPSLDPVVLAAIAHTTATPQQVAQWEQISRGREEEGRQKEVTGQEEVGSPKKQELEAKIKEFEEKKTEEEERIGKRRTELETLMEDLKQKEIVLNEAEKVQVDRKIELERYQKDLEEREKEFQEGREREEQRMEDLKKELEKIKRQLGKKEEMLKEAQDRIIALPPTTTRSHTKETPIPKTEESGPISKKGTSSIEEETEKEAVGASFKAPLMTIGDTEVHIPLPLGTLSKIKELCPNPKKYPRDAGIFLAKYSAGTGLDKDDIKGILSIVDPDSPEVAPVDDLWTTHIQTDKDWISFWKGMGGHWSKLYKGSSALQELILAKQEPKEKFYDYCNRVYSLWKAVDGATQQLFTTTIMSGGDPKVTQLLKFTNPKWAEQAPDEFIKDARSREISGVFEQKGGIFPSLTQTQTLVTPETSSSPPHLMTMQPYPPDQGCFNCGEQGHWKSQCPYRQRVSYPRGRGRGYNAANRPPPPHITRYPQYPPPPQTPSQNHALAQPPYTPTSNRPPPRIPMQWPSTRQTHPQ
ncbi:uncharacterized protein LOC143975555 [Lithobates pipiens]